MLELIEEVFKDAEDHYNTLISNQGRAYQRRSVVAQTSPSAIQGGGTRLSSLHRGMNDYLSLQLCQAD